MNLSRAGPAVIPARTGFHCVAGASAGSNGTFRGPVRRSSIAAIDRRHVAAAIVRSASVIVTCTNFSASANVAGETAGPTSGAVPNVGGAPGVEDVDGTDDFCSSPRQAAATPSRPIGAWIRNCRRVFTNC
jgi:hypothetical protein